MPQFFIVILSVIMMSIILLSVIILNIIMLNVIVLSVIMLNVIMLSVIALPQQNQMRLSDTNKKLFPLNQIIKMIKQAQKLCMSLKIDE